MKLLRGWWDSDPITNPAPSSANKGQRLDDNTNLQLWTDKALVGSFLKFITGFQLLSILNSIPFLLRT